MTTKQRSANGASASVAQKQFSLWRDNRTDQEYKMTGREIADKLFASEWFKQWNAEAWTSLDRVWRLFLMAPETPTEQWPKAGLGSVMDESDIQNVSDFIHVERPIKYPPSRETTL